MVYNNIGDIMIKSIIQQMRLQQAEATKELVPDGRTMTSQLGNIKRAEENLNQLFIDLRNEVSKNAIVILVKGDSGQQFSKIAEDFGCLTFEAEAPFKKISDRVDDSYLGKTASDSILDIAMGALSDISHEVGILGYNYVQFRNDDAVHLNNRKDLENLIAKTFNREIGAELVVLYTIHEAALKIRDSDFEGSRVPLVLYSENSNLIDQIAMDSKRLNMNVFVLESNGKVDDKAVEKQLTKINQKVKKGNV